MTYSQNAITAMLAFHTKRNFKFPNDNPDVPDNIVEKDNTLYDKIGFFPLISVKEGMKRIALNKKSIL
jgi:hypothetical protein